MKSLLAIVSHTPYKGDELAEFFDSVMVAAAFDFDVSLLFIEDGVWALQANQDGARIARRTISKMLAAFADYEIDKLYVCETSLSERNVNLPTDIHLRDPVGSH